MSDEIRYGIIGTGMMGVEHIYNVRHLDGAKLTAVSDPDAVSRETGRKAADVPEAAAFADHRELLGSGLCDAVVVATPNHTHADVLVDVLAADVHVMAEKPLCTTVEDCKRVLAAVEGHRGVAWMALEYRYMAPIARLVEEVDVGTAGTVHMVAIREHRFPFLPKVGDWNRFTANTGGTLVEKCCHFFDLMNLAHRCQRPYASWRRGPGRQPPRRALRAGRARHPRQRVRHRRVRLRGQGDPRPVHVRRGRPQRAGARRRRRRRQDRGVRPRVRRAHRPPRRSVGTRRAHPAHRRQRTKACTTERATSSTSTSSSRPYGFPTEGDAAGGDGRRCRRGRRPSLDRGEACGGDGRDPGIGLPTSWARSH